MAFNLLAALDDERYGSAGLAAAHDAAARAGYTLRRVPGGDAHLGAWIDLHFPGSWWSSEMGLKMSVMVSFPSRESRERPRDIDRQ